MCGMTETHAPVSSAVESILMDALHPAPAGLSEDQFLRSATMLGMMSRKQRRQAGYRGSLPEQMRQWPRFDLERRLEKALEGLDPADASYHEGVLRSRFAKMMPNHPQCEKRGHDLRQSPEGKIVCVRQPA